MDNRLDLLKEVWGKIDTLNESVEPLKPSGKIVKKKATENLVAVPTEQIRSWISSHMDELLQKLQETYTKGYNTYVEDAIVIGEHSITVNIQKKLLSASVDIESALHYNEKEDAIYISADALVKNLKSLAKIKSFVSQGIWHELTHVLDPNRTSHSQEFGSYDLYINSPREFPAFARMYIEHLRDADKALQMNAIQALRTGKKIPVKDIQEWYQKLTPKNKEMFKASCIQELVGPNA